MAKRSTAAIVIIGDEILKGQVVDTNSHFLAQRLYNIGVHVQRISVIPDVIETIAEEIKFCSMRFTFVITSGGIGPTHDDVTYEGIAKAFGEEMVFNKTLLGVLKKLCPLICMDGSKMAMIPFSANVHLVKDKNNSKSFSFPVVYIKNVYIFPGIPDYLQYSFPLIEHLFSSQASALLFENIYVNVTEFEIIDTLNDAVEKFKNKVKFGSYPEIGNNNYQVRITMEAECRNLLADARSYIRAHFPENCLVSPLDPSSPLSVERVYQLAEGNFQNKYNNSKISEVVNESIHILEKCFDQYPVSSVCIGFNGGKDCTALLHLLKSVLCKQKKDVNAFKAFYVCTHDSFQEVEDFVQQCVKSYNLQLISYEAPHKSALWQMHRNYPEIKAVLMGTRKTDPDGLCLQPFQPTDSGWPQMMRVNCLLHWGYSDVWDFLNLLEIPYCSLYDKGYTSLGNKTNTFPNPLLKHTAEDGSEFYRPAYLLTDPSQERNCRL